nr:DUF4436 family protein [Mycobacterium lacus]
MLFAIVPLRNILPGSPPPGSWVDQACNGIEGRRTPDTGSECLVAWYRHSDSRATRHTLKSCSPS